jgi:hypothetical protein
MISLCLAVDIKMCFTSESAGSFMIYLCTNFHHQYKFQSVAMFLPQQLPRTWRIYSYVTAQTPSTSYEMPPSLQNRTATMLVLLFAGNERSLKLNSF